MIAIALPLAFSLFLQAGNSRHPSSEISEHFVGIRRSAFYSWKTLVAHDDVLGANFSIKTSIDGTLLPAPGPSTTAEPPNNSAQPLQERAILYQDDKTDPAGKPYVGSVVWNIDKSGANGERSPKSTVRAYIEIPSRRIGVRLSIERNDDMAVPASHTIAIIFTLAPDFPRSDILNVPGVIMQQGQSTPGVPLAGRTMKVSNNFFLVSLSSNGPEMQRNIGLLKQRSWFVIPFVYPDGRAIIAFEKGASGERVFADAFAMWGKAGPGPTDSLEKGQRY